MTTRHGDDRPGRPGRVGTRAAARRGVLALGALLALPLATPCTAQPTRAALDRPSSAEPDTVRRLRAALDSLDALRPRREATPAETARRDATRAATWRALGEQLEDGTTAGPARAAYDSALAAAGAAGDSATLGAVRQLLGVLFLRASRYDSAVVFFGGARDVRLALHDSAGLGRSLNSLGAAWYQLGVYDEAIAAFGEARDLREAVGDRRGVALVFANIGKAYLDWQQYDRARAMLAVAVRRAREAGDSAATGYALNTLADLHLVVGDTAEAAAAIAASRAAYESGAGGLTTDDSLSGWSLNAISGARLALVRGRPADALRTLDSVRAVAVARGSVRGEARALVHMGNAYADLARPAEARRAVERALTLADRADQRLLALEAERLLASLAERQGRTADALAHLRAADRRREAIFNEATSQRIAALEARRVIDRGREENARLRAEQAVQAAVIARQRAVVLLGGVALLLGAALVTALTWFNQRGRAREAALVQANADLAEANTELRTALAEVRTLKGLIPICASCKRVRDDDGYWKAVETYIASRSEATFSHGICQRCGPELYGEHWDATVAGGGTA